MKGRFAPSPTGRMHLGNIYAALLSWLSARRQGGQWVLRIEDIDPQRSRQEWREWIMDDLQWLGLTWDEGPLIGGDNAPYEQSKRGEFYMEALRQLNDKALLYPCHCTRADILATQAPHESDGRVVYKGTCRPAHLTPLPLQQLSISPLSTSQQSTPQQSTSPLPPSLTPMLDGASPMPTLEGAPQPPHDAALRMVAQGTVTFTDRHYGRQTVDLSRECGDFIVRRRDGAWAYQLCCVVDDALMGITEVVRGRDLLLSSPQQIYVARMLGYDPPSFAHLPLLVNSHGQRLSKRDKALDLSVLRQRHTAAEITGRLAFLAGLIPQPFSVTPRELTELFSWDRVPTNDVLCI